MLTFDLLPGTETWSGHFGHLSAAWLTWPQKGGAMCLTGEFRKKKLSQPSLLQSAKPAAVRPQRERCPAADRSSQPSSRSWAPGQLAAPVEAVGTWRLPWLPQRALSPNPPPKGSEHWLNVPAYPISTGPVPPNSSSRHTLLLPLPPLHGK